MLNQLLNKWKEFVNLMNSNGIPLPVVRDPKTGFGSVSLTLVVISSLLVVAGIIGKWSNKLGQIDIANALQFFYAACFLYFGRNMPSMTSKEKEKEPAQPNSATQAPDNPDA